MLGEYIIKVTVDVPLSVLSDFMDKNKLRINNSELKKKMFNEDINLIDDLCSLLPTDKKYTCYKAVLSVLANVLNIKK